MFLKIEELLNGNYIEYLPPYPYVLVLLLYLYNKYLYSKIKKIIIKLLTIIKSLEI